MSELNNPEVDSSAADDDFVMWRKRRHVNGDAISGLNLTAMMDILTILLVYLIKVYAEAPDNIEVSAELTPPTSTAPTMLVPSVNVQISTSAVLVDGKPVLNIVNGQVASTDGAAAYAPLAAALAKRVETIEAVAARGGAEFNGNLMIVAHETTPYDLISNVLFQAGMAKYTTFNLVVQVQQPSGGK